MTITNKTLSPRPDLVEEKYQRLAPQQQEQVRALLASPQKIASADPRVNEMVSLARANRMTAETLTTWMHQLAQASSSSPELTEVPTCFHAASTTLVHAVPLNSSKAEFTHFEVVTLRDKAGHSLCFNVGVPRDAFTPATVVVLIDDGNPRVSQPLNPSLALSLLPLLDAAVSGPTLESDRHLSAGMKVLRFVLTHTEGVAGSGKPANSFRNSRRFRLRRKFSTRASTTRHCKRLRRSRRHRRFLPFAPSRASTSVSVFRAAAR